MTQDCNKYSGWRILLRVLHAFLLSAKHFLGISGCCRKSQKTCAEHWSLSPAVRGTFRWCWLMFPHAGARWLWLCFPQLSIAGWLKDPEVSLAQVPVPAAQQFVFLQVRGCELGSAVLSPSRTAPQWQCASWRVPTSPRAPPVQRALAGRSSTIWGLMGPQRQFLSHKKQVCVGRRPLKWDTLGWRALLSVQ